MTAQCSAISNALNAKGYSYTQLAGQVGLSAKHVEDICAGKIKPTQQEFTSIAQALGLSSSPKHAAQITA